MNSELNNYNINNPDGAEKVKFNEGKKFYDNDSPRYIKEDSVRNIKETSKILETSDGRTKNSDRKASSSVSDSSGNGVDSVSSSASSVSSASTAASASSAASAASAASAIGGSVGALAGTVAASAMAAVIVVAAFVSTLVINLSLAMAGMYSLVFEIEMTGAQEEDFVNPIVAVLEDGNGVYREQEIYPDTLFITFDDLEPGTEYFITIRNEEKVFVKKSYFTTTEEVEKGFISAYYEGDEVFVSVEDVSLKSGEFYTVTAKDDKGKVVFAKDDIEPNKEFLFKLSDFKDLSFTLSVNGKVYSLTQIHVQVEPPVEQEYDYANPVWAWEDDFSAATLSFREIHGGETLTFAAEITHSEVEPTCETDGQYVYVATVNCNNKQYSDTKTSVRENTALGHEYGEPQFAWEQDESGYRAVAIFVCRRDDKHLMTLPATVSQDGDTFYTEVEYDREPYSGELPAEYDYNNPVWEWEIDYGTVSSDSATATISFAEIHGGEAAVYNASILPRIKTSATCDSPEIWYYQADTSELIQEIPNMPYYCEYSDEFAVGSPLGHEYGEPVFEWSEDGDYGYTAKAIFTCLHDDSHILEMDADVIQGNYEFTAYVEYNGQMYENTLYLENPDEPMPSNGVELSLNDGNIILYADGYAQNGVFTAFENTENSRYIISGSQTADTPLKFDVKTYSGASVNGVVNYYVDFDNAEILGDSGVWATALIIYPYSPVNIYMANVGTGKSMIKGYNHVAFKIQKASELVNIYIDSEGEFESFDCGDWYHNSSHLYDNNANIHVYMNGVEVDDYGTPKNG